MMTEAEAKQKWCPFVRHAELNIQHGINRHGDPGGWNPDFSRCLGSECMQWRWEESVVPAGYCGLGGKP